MKKQTMEIIGIVLLICGGINVFDDDVRLFSIIMFLFLGAFILLTNDNSKKEVLQ